MCLKFTPKAVWDDRQCYNEREKTWFSQEIRTIFQTLISQIILRPLSALSLDEGLNSPCDKNASAALWKREPISDDYLPSMGKPVLSISGNVYKQQEMEIDKVD
jgi:hypothetical protein